MIKHFCDICGIELGDFNKFPEDDGGTAVKLTGGDGVVLRVRLVLSRNGIQNGGDFCKYCIIRAINTADDRPRCA